LYNKRLKQPKSLIYEYGIFKGHEPFDTIIDHFVAARRLVDYIGLYTAKERKGLTSTHFSHTDTQIFTLKYQPAYRHSNAWNFT